MEPAPLIPNTDDNATRNGAQPEKYIRTFAGDMKTVQEKGIPDLVPLVQAPTAPLIQAQPSAQPLSKQPEPVLVPLKTYAGDFSERIKETHASTATIIAAEQDRAPRAVRSTEEKFSRSNRFYVIAGIVLLLAGSAGAYSAYTRYEAARAPIILAPRVSAPIFVDEREEISGRSGELIQAITQSIAQPLVPNTVRLLYLPSATTTHASVFSELDVSAPDVLLRNLNAAGSMAGVVSAGGGQSPFFILSVTTYGSTLAGMLSWETVMPRALAALFPLNPALAVLAATSTSKIATTTPPVPVFIPGFRDEVVRNHDVRIYRDEAGRSVLLYGYWNQMTLVIARSPSAFTEILERLATSRTEQ